MRMILPCACVTCEPRRAAAVDCPCGAATMIPAMKRDFTHALPYATKILDAWLPYKIQYDRIPGLAVGIVYQGKLVYQRGFGYADVDANIPVTPNTGFRIASISKTFTAVAIMQLVEQGKIALDDRVEKYVPWFRARTKDADSKNITIRQLLAHTGGIWRDGDTAHWEDGIFPDHAALKKSFSRQALVFENLTRFKYSNFGFALLGEVIANVSGEHYDEYVTTHLIAPLGMTRTAPDFKKEHDAWLAKGYGRPIPHTARETITPTPTYAYAPAAGFLSTVPDLAKYLAALSLAQKKENLLVHNESKKKLMRKHGGTGVAHEWYGLGFEISTIAQRKIVGHGGLCAGFGTHLSLDVENDLGVIVLTNTYESSCEALAVGIFETLYYFADEKRALRKASKISAQEKFEGAYRSREEDRMVVGVDTALLAFSPQTHSPTKSATVLTQKGRATFLMETKSNYSAQGEKAVFHFGRKGGRATMLMLATTPLKRITSGR